MLNRLRKWVGLRCVVKGWRSILTLTSRAFILLNEDIDAVLDGDKRDIRLLDARDLAGSARVIDFGPGVEYYCRVDLLHGSFAIGVGGAGWEK